MKYIKLFENYLSYFGQCDKIRKTPDGEIFWHKMMDNKIKISKSEFLKNVNILDILDEDGTLEEFIAGDPDSYYAKSNVDGEIVYFLGTHGFEFIWK